MKAHKFKSNLYSIISHKIEKNYNFSEDILTFLQCCSICIPSHVPCFSCTCTLYTLLFICVLHVKQSNYIVFSAKFLKIWKKFFMKIYIFQLSIFEWLTLGSCYVHLLYTRSYGNVFKYQMNCTHPCTPTYAF